MATDEQKRRLDFLATGCNRTADSHPAMAYAAAADYVAGETHVPDKPSGQKLATLVVYLARHRDLAALQSLLDDW
jgi:hypothetical protein